MAIGAGYNASISYIAESTFGTLPSSPTWLEIGRVKSVDVSLNSEHVSIYGLDTQTRLFAPQGNESYEISVDTYINDVTWTFIKEIDDSQSYSVLVKQSIGGTNYYAIFVGCVINEVAVSGSVGEAWSASITMKAKQINSNEVTSTAPAGETAYTRSSTTPYMCHGGVLSAGTGWTTGASSDMTEVTDVEFTINYNYTDNYVLSDNVVEGFYEGNIENSFSFTCNFTNLEQITRILNDESGQLKLEIVDGAQNILFANCVFDELSWPLAEGELTNLDISGTAGSVTLADS